MFPLGTLLCLCLLLCLQSWSTLWLSLKPAYFSLLVLFLWKPSICLVLSFRMFVKIPPFFIVSKVLSLPSILYFLKSLPQIKWFSGCFWFLQIRPKFKTKKVFLKWSLVSSCIYIRFFHWGRVRPTHLLFSPGIISSKVKPLIKDATGL